MRVHLVACIRRYEDERSGCRLNLWRDKEDVGGVSSFGDDCALHVIWDCLSTKIRGEGEDSPLSLCEGEDSPLSLGKRCEKNYSSVRRYVADPDNAYPKRSITKLLLNQKCMGYLVRAYYSISPTKGKENGIYILQSIDHGPFELGTTRDTLGTTPEDGVLLRRERPRTYDDLNDNDKKRFDADVCVTNIVLQGLPKDIYKLINHNIKAKSIWDNVKMLLAGSELTKKDKESQLVNLPQTNNQLRTSSNARNQATVQDGRIVDKMLLMQAQENGAVLDEEELLFLAKNTIDHYDDNQDEHKTHNKVQQKPVINSNGADMGNNNVIPYEQYLTINEVSVEPSCASSVPNDAYMLHDNNAYIPHDPLVIELNIYKQQVAMYEQRAKFDLTLHEQKMDE
ncbi:hypothetical protein Tco_0365764 [Tanacetum coccineum]